MASTQRASEHSLYDMYDVHHVLGEGAYATVVKALHRREGAWYAVKMFKADKLSHVLDGHDPAAPEGFPLTHFQKEIQILRRLDHPNVCKLREAFYEGDSISKRLILLRSRATDLDVPDVVLELCKGGDLMKYLMKHEHKILREYIPPPYLNDELTSSRAVEPEAQDITYQICEALEVGDPLWAYARTFQR